MIQGKRDKKSVTKIVTWCCEADDITKTEQWKMIDQSPLKPSCIIESKNSLHMYWFSLDGTKENREKIGELLMKFFN